MNLYQELDELHRQLETLDEESDAIEISRQEIKKAIREARQQIEADWYERGLR